MNMLDIEFLSLSDYGVISLRIFLSAVIGGIIGLERRYRGSPVGFRTYAIVSMASCILMLLSVYQWKLLPVLPEQLAVIRIDPIRMAQGVLTGIGFLGAGLVIKERLSIRGLTTAAMIWLTSAIGLLVGVGFFFPSLVGLIVTLFILFAHERFENFTQTRYFGTLKVRVAKKMSHQNIMDIEKELVQVISQEKFFIKEKNFIVDNDISLLEFVFSIYSHSNDNYALLVNRLKKMELVGMVQLIYT